MKIILTQDVPRIGVKGTLHDLSTSYAMNSFVNKGLARIATAKDEKQILDKEAKKKEEAAKKQDKYIEVFTKIEKESSTNPIILNKKVDEKGNFYAKISGQDILDVIFSVAKVSINESQIITDLHNIKTVGDYEIILNINNRKYKIHINVVSL
ncbi:MAG: large subunit ribosomal protein [Patescibacteria group bacterium]|nr:large subunit ribosomal protein [Patescibacteria group bacterium]